jgi:hypothetical protein
MTDINAATVPVRSPSTGRGAAAQEWRAGWRVIVASLYGYILVSIGMMSMGAFMAPMQNAFHWNPEDQTEFLNTYLQFLREYSAKLGMLCDGWWFDGCYEEIHKGRWGWENWCKAARTGNPNAAIAFNDGAFCVGRLKPVSSLQDYHAGEVHLLEDSQIRLDPLVGGGVYTNEDGKLRKPNQEARLYMPDARFIDGVQWHALIPVDSTFNADVPSDKVDYSDAELLKFVSGCRKVKGAVTMNLPIGIDGHIPDKSASKLARLSKALK